MTPLKKARRWLEANNIDYRFMITARWIGQRIIERFYQRIRLGSVTHTRGTTWRKLDETTRNKITDAASAATLMTEMPAIIKRPLLCAPGKPMLLGFSESSYQQFFHEV